MMRILPKLNTGARLILLLVSAVAIVMFVGGMFTLRQREALLENAMLSEIRAHALTLQIALEDLYRNGRPHEAQQLIDRLIENPRVYSVIVYDHTGQVAYGSNPSAEAFSHEPDQVKQVLRTGQSIEIFTPNNEHDVLSVIVPLQLSANQRGALEISQPRDFLRLSFNRARRDIVITGLAIFVVIVIIVLVVMRYSLLRPINELLQGASAIGRGDLDFRVIVPRSGSEFSQLASEFNRMAENISVQQKEIETAAERKIALERALRQSERLAAVGRLAAGVAHEMGAPLNVIKGRVGMLRPLTDENDAKSDRHLTIIDAQADKITLIVRNLLSLARQVRYKNEPVNISDLIAEVVELLQPEAQRSKVDFQLLTSHQTVVDGDQNLLHQVLLNLCINAIHAMPRGGLIVIETIPQASNRDELDFMAIRVADTGTGIAEEHLPHIFDPFFTTKEIGQGTGLGLAVSHRFVEEHGGWIEAANRSEGGAQFMIYLPQANETNQSNGADLISKEGNLQHGRTTAHRRR